MAAIPCLVPVRDGLGLLETCGVCVSDAAGVDEAAIAESGDFAGRELDGNCLFGFEGGHGDY